MIAKRLRRGDLVWYFGKLMYFNYTDKAKGYYFSVPSSNTETGYLEICLSSDKLMLHGNL